MIHLGVSSVLQVATYILVVKQASTVPGTCNQRYICSDHSSRIVCCSERVFSLSHLSEEMKCIVS